MKKLFLLDGHALIYRAHYAFITRPLFNSKGWNVSAIHGFVRMLWDMFLREKPTHLAVVFDPPGGTFRHEQYEPYKANRQEQPEDITLAIPWVEKIVRAMNLPVVIVPNYEADDVMGALARQAAEQGYEVYLVTPDKDMGQLVTDRIFLYKPGRQGNEIEIWGPAEVCERWGIQRVEQVVDMLGLMGDSVDNIPGLPGVGEKTATRLLAEYGTIENVLKNAQNIKGKVGEIVAKHGEQALLSKWLATIDTNAPVTFDEKAFEVEPFDREALLDIFKELEFRTLANDILKHPLAGAPAPSSPKPAADASGRQGSLFEDDPPPPGESASPPEIRHASKNIHNTPHHYHLADTPERRAELLQLLLTRTAVAYDSETTAIEPTQADLVGFSFAFKPHEAWYVPIPADRAQAQAIVEEFRPFFENENIEKIGQNLKYDAVVLKNYDVELRGPLWDTMIAHYLLEPELRHNLNYLAEAYLDYSPVKIEDLIGKKGATQGNMRDVPLEQIKEYAAEDADLALQLKNHLEPLLESGGPNLVRLFQRVECPLIKVLADMEFAGVCIDTHFLKEYSLVLAADIQALEQKILQETGHTFNVSSPKQVGEVLFERLKIPYPGKKMKSGQYSTDEEVLSSLATEYPVCADILQHRALQKLRSTYVEALPALVNPRTGRVHSSFNQALAATGRLSSQNPNLQNIPIRTPEGRRVREAFIPRDEEHLILSADYSQIELRLIAHISNEEAMLEAFRKNQDIHQATAARVFGVPLEQVTPEQRRAAKTVNFSIIYGAGAVNLSNQLGIKRTEAKELIDNYFAQYPGLKRYMETIVDFARTNGYVETLLGRRRYLRDIHSRNGMNRSMAERMAINTPIQGTAADLIKVAMVNIWKALRAAHMRSHLILQVHDELVFDARKDELDALQALVREKMTSALPDLRVPIVVEMGAGKNWLEAH
ncbi:MAG: DNA polymerase I [Saprospiraceae bacterium]|nr:DNA polymerase I [Saprospiraceae bacterium]MDW8229579.1 DNA polymerase I [Saprospiraceae bacterium]